MTETKYSSMLFGPLWVWVWVVYNTEKRKYECKIWESRGDINNKKSIVLDRVWDKRQSLGQKNERYGFA
jgi:hypothetical protein